MTEQIWLKECYTKEFEAEVEEVLGKYVMLNRTAFYPESGGQPTDKGTMECEGSTYSVLFVNKVGTDIRHEVDREGLKKGDKVKCKIEWERRHIFMRYHTAAHILSGVINQKTGALITGNQISEDKARLDFSLEKFDQEIMSDFIKEANQVISKQLPVHIHFMAREEAFKIPAIVKLAKFLPESITEIRVIDVEGFDQQACAGCHVKNTSEIGVMEIIKAENKGKDNRRVYFALK
ncbi:MAG: alanyl-tRNA editing protein AlaXM [Candidatus Nanoarchaeia archaeon]|nr:alanyl-tRNA editing protein AlaXM [Candidatus Nanoarchaeia archaeon]